MRIICHIVMKNEADRWLQSSLKWNLKFCDEIHIYDDQSDDDSVLIAKQYTDNVSVRPDDVPSFVEDESAFRQAAWNDMEKVCEPEKGDWILCLDADEFIVGNSVEKNVRKELDTLIEFAENSKKMSVSIRRPEIWDLCGSPKCRVDGFWDKDRPVRLVKWKSGGKFKNVKLGCGSIPDYGFKGQVQNLQICYILHFGYAIEGTNKSKYDFYSSVQDNAHSREHLDSLLKTPKLKEYNGPMPTVWRGYCE